MKALALLLLVGCVEPPLYPKNTCINTGYSIIQITEVAQQHYYYKIVGNRDEQKLPFKSLEEDLAGLPWKSCVEYGLE